VTNNKADLPLRVKEALVLSLEMTYKALLEEYYIKDIFTAGTHTDNAQPSDTAQTYDLIILIEHMIQALAYQPKEQTIMKATYNNSHIEGTPEEIAAFFAAVSTKKQDTIEETNRLIKKTSNEKPYIKSIDEMTPEELVKMKKALFGNKKSIPNYDNSAKGIQTYTDTKSTVNFTNQRNLIQAAINTQPQPETFFTYPVNPTTQFEIDSESELFLNNLFYYEPSRDSSTGRGAYVAKTLLTKRAYTVKDLKRISLAKTQSVRKTIERMTRAGCTFDISAPRMGDKVIVKLTSMGTVEQAIAVYHATGNNNTPLPNLFQQEL
jgi:hypothetical protein